VRFIKAISSRGIALIAAVSLVTVYSLIDPEKHVWMPRCVFHRLTGLDCPGCGAQRMAYALLHGDIDAAWGYNPFLMLLLPLLVFMIWLELYRKKKPVLYARFYSTTMIYILSALIITWFILRNFVL